jgi:hypothetical protein
MTENHAFPITPPPELVQQWREAPEFSALFPCVMVTVTTTKLQDIATQAAQWGSDEELEACCEWLSVPCPSYGRELRNARRPKPPRSLKEQALETLKYPKDFWSEAEVDTIRRALEQLND